MSLEVKPGWPEPSSGQAQDRGTICGGTFPEIRKHILLSCHQGWILTSNEAPSLGNMPFYRPLRYSYIAWDILVSV